MIETTAQSPQVNCAATTEVFLVRYGAVPEVARCDWQGGVALQRGDEVILQSQRGLQLGRVLERLKTTATSPAADFRIERLATAADLSAARDAFDECEAEYAAWCSRIEQWRLNLELVDLEWTLDHQKLILYVLCERGPDSTTLALQAAAAGFGIVEVQPVSSTGILPTSPGGSCGSGNGGCGCSH